MFRQSVYTGKKKKKKTLRDPRNLHSPPMTQTCVLSRFKHKNDNRGHRKNKKLEEQMKKRNRTKTKSKLVEFFKVGQYLSTIS